MLNTAEEYTSLIKGQTPDEEKHDIFIDVEPVSLCKYIAKLIFKVH